MRVIHYITTISRLQSPQVQALRSMLTSTANAAENYLVVSAPLSEDAKNAFVAECGVTIHSLPESDVRNPLSLLSFYVAMRRLVAEISPSIVHVHGAWDVRAAIAELVGRKLGSVTIVSPHRGLSSEIMNIDFCKQKLPRLIAYQIMMVRKCTAVIAVTESERQSLIDMGLKKRIEVMPKLVFQSDEAMADIRNNLLAAYQKALDSTYYKRITKAEKLLVARALHKAVTGENPSGELLQEANPSLRNMLFYAYDEGVLKKFIEGARSLSLRLPEEVDVPSIPRYRNRKAKDLTPLSEIKQPVMKTNLTEGSLERTAVEMIYRARKKTIPRLTLSHFVELYSLFRHSDFNEDEVLVELKRLHLLAFTKKIQKQLAELFSLPEGYMLI